MKDAKVSEAKCGEWEDFIFITFPFKKKEKKNHLPVPLTKKKAPDFPAPKRALVLKGESRLWSVNPVSTSLT